MEELSLAGYREPLGLWSRRVAPPDAAPEPRAHRFEYSSRGDRVPGRLWLPRSAADEAPLVLLQPADASDREGNDARAAAWAQRGAAVATIELPLHGERTDPKLGALVGTPFAPGTLAAAEALRIEWVRQAVIDLERALDALGTREEIDRDRIAFAGLGPGALIGAIFCGLDPRPRTAALVGAGAGIAASVVDPGSYVGRFAPRPLLLLQQDGDASVSREAAQALHRAAGGSAEQRFLGPDDDASIGAVMESIWAFIAPALSLEDRTRG